MEQILGQDQIASVLHRRQTAPGRIGFDAGLEGINGLLGVAHGGDKDIVRVLGDDSLHAQILQQRLVPGCNVVGSQLFQHLTGHIVIRLGLGCGGQRPDKQHCGLLLRLGCLHLGKDLINLLLDIQAVFLIEILPPGDVGADLQHGKIVLKGLHLEVSMGDSRLGQGVVQIHMAFHIGGKNHKVRVQCQQFLGIRLLDSADHLGVLADLHTPLGDIVIGDAHRHTACQSPGLRIGAHQHCHTLRLCFQHDLLAQCVGEGVIGLGLCGLGGGFCAVLRGGSTACQYSTGHHTRCQQSQDAFCQHFAPPMVSISRISSLRLSRLSAMSIFSTFSTPRRSTV